jgi:phosphoribosylformimino-5-aminoimidazole carboxamide ribotide isomerase
MIIIPAVDIKNGKCVRLIQGRQEDETVFSNDPAAMAQKWAKAGAELIHVVDLDGAFEKSPQNLEAIKNILNTVATPIQLGGGIRNEQTVMTLLDMGVQRVIIGTEAIRNPEWVMQTALHFPDQVVVGIDARDGRVAIEGWTETTHIQAIDLAKRFEDCGAPLLISPIFIAMACKQAPTLPKPGVLRRRSAYRLWLQAVSRPSKT